MQQNFNTFDLLVSPEQTRGRPYYMDKQNQWRESFDKLKTKKQPGLQELEEFFSQPPHNFSTIFHSLKLKYHTLTIEPSALEKTMTPWQLYNANSPHWTRELTAEEADAVLMHTVGTCTLTEDEFNDHYQKALSGELIKKPFNLRMFW